MEIDVENSVYGQRAKQLFLEGYNCSQSVFLAFEDKYDMDHSTAMKLSSSLVEEWEDSGRCAVLCPACLW